MLYTEIFKYAGSTVAIILGILKIIEFAKNKPVLSIKKASCFYDYIGNKKTHVDITFELANIGRKPITIKRIAIDLLDRKKVVVDKDIFSLSFNVKKKLEPGDYIDIPVEYTYDVKLPHKNYSISAKLITAHKKCTYTITMPMIFMFLSMSDVEVILKSRMKKWIQKNT